MAIKAVALAPASGGNWTGWHVGGHVGYSRSRAGSNTTLANISW